MPNNLVPKTGDYRGSRPQRNTKEEIPKEEYKMIFDSHAHYDDKAFDEDRIELFDKIQRAGVKRVLNCGADLSVAKKPLN